MKIVSVPCLQDNYAYLIICETSGQAAVVDPSEAAPVEAACLEHNANLKAILNTHHHWDHTGGNAALKQAFPELEIYGFHSDRGRIEGQTHFLEDGDKISVGQLEGRVMHNPGHTDGAVTYIFEDAAFTGDTLFAAGCGRTFEGTAEQMYDSLNRKIGGLSESTRLYFGHEYTAHNLRFAQAVEPQNNQIQLRLEKVRQWREQGQFTTPTPLSEERKTNPFLRCSVPEVIAAARQQEPDMDTHPADVFRVLRAWKDQF